MYDLLVYSAVIAVAWFITKALSGLVHYLDIVEYTKANECTLEDAIPNVPVSNMTLMFNSFVFFVMVYIGLFLLWK
tara:strand:+ start:533 stop:760 length:228 start_codon:yes stop_codon:yes gene_type:complete